MRSLEWLTTEADTMIEHAQKVGRLARQMFTDPNVDLHVATKDDGTYVTDMDRMLSERTQRAFIYVACEEGDHALYGMGDMYYSDPLDATNNMLAGLAKRPRHSIAAFSLARVVRGLPVIGVVNFPLLRRDRSEARIYSGIEGQATVLEAPLNKMERLPQIDTEATKGVVFVTDQRSALAEQLRRQGLTPRSAPGSVFRATCLVDPQLANLYEPGLIAEDETVVGYACEKSRPHSFLATAVIARGVGAIVGGFDGGDLKLDFAPSGCIFANNQQVFDRIRTAAQEL